MKTEDEIKKKVLEILTIPGDLTPENKGFLDALMWVYV